MEELNLLLLLLQWFKPVAIYSALVLAVFKIGVAFWWRPRRIQSHFYRQGIRGPPYRFFIGNVKEIVAMTTKASSQPMPRFSHNILPRVLSFYHHWKKIYGSTFLVWFGPTVRLTISDPDMVREILTSKSEVFEKSEQHPLVKQLEGDGLLSLKGEKWAHHRRVMTPTFYTENLKMLVPVVGNSVKEILDRWAGMMSEAGEVEIEIEVSEWFQNLTEDVVTRMAFGGSHQDGKAIFRLQAQQMVLAAEAFQKVFIPGYRFLPTRRNVEAWKLDWEVRKSLVKLIEGREQEGRRNDGEYAKDLLGMMIEASGRCPEMTKRDIVEECKGFFFAGKHSTSNMLTWTTLLLAMHPQWQLRAREELSRVCGSRDVPTMDDLVKLKTLTMIVNESLRLYPPVVAMIRQAKSDTELGCYTIPRGTEILIPVLAVHHDQTVWGGDANEFNPGRFSEGVARSAKSPGALIPFGMGVRTCIGQNLAILQAKLTLSMMIRRFSFRVSPSYRHAPTVLMLLYPQHGAPILFDRWIDPQDPRDQGS